MTKQELEERLINFTVSIVEIAETMPDSRTASYFAGQIIRSGSSPALNYGEAQSAESRKDFIHKMKIILKELRETFICLKIIHRLKLFRSEEKVNLALSESNELISIFVKSVETAQKNMEKESYGKSKIINR
jgi:four helix bundle protein